MQRQFRWQWIKCTLELAWWIICVPSELYYMYVTRCNQMMVNRAHSAFAERSFRHTSAAVWNSLSAKCTVHTWNQLLPTGCSCGLVAHLATLPVPIHRPVAQVKFDITWRTMSRTKNSMQHCQTVTSWAKWRNHNYRSQIISKMHYRWKEVWSSSTAVHVLQKGVYTFDSPHQSCT